MTLTWLFQIEPQLFTAKRSERQAVVSNAKDEGGRVARLTRQRTEAWYKAKWEWIRLHNKSKSEMFDKIVDPEISHKNIICKINWQCRIKSLTLF